MAEEFLYAKLSIFKINICSFLNPSTQRKIMKFICKSTMAHNCVHAGGRVKVLVHDTISYWGEDLSQILLSYQSLLPSFVEYRQAVFEI